MIGTPRPEDTKIPVDIRTTPDQAATAAWRQLTSGLSASWLHEIETMRTKNDDLDISLDIWSIALIAALKDDTRRETASIVLTRLRRLDDGTAE